MQTHSTTDSPASTSNGSTDSESIEGKYLTLALGTEEYGIPVGFVREIVGLLPITRLPNMPSDMPGVVNLRGKVVPVVDLRGKLGMAPIDLCPRTCIVVLQVQGAGLIGLLVDSVIEVMVVAAADIDRTPGIASSEHGVLAVAKIRGTVRVLLEVSTILRDEIARGAVES